MTPPSLCMTWVAIYSSAVLDLYSLMSFGVLMGKRLVSPCICQRVYRYVEPNRPTLSHVAQTAWLCKWCTLHVSGLVHEKRQERSTQWKTGESSDFGCGFWIMKRRCRYSNVDVDEEIQSQRWNLNLQKGFGSGTNLPGLWNPLSRLSSGRHCYCCCCCCCCWCV